MLSTLKVGHAGDATLGRNGEDPTLPPQAPINKGGQPRRTSRGSCIYCHQRHLKCDYADGKIPCTRCEAAGLDNCQPYQSIPRQPPHLPPRYTFNVGTPATPAIPASPAAMSPSRSVRGPQRTEQEQADYEARNRFDNSDAESDEQPPEHVLQLTSRRRWAASQQGSGRAIETQYATRAEHIMKHNQQIPQPAQQAGMRPFAGIEAEEEVIGEDLDGPSKRILQPDQIMQLANDEALAILEQTDIFDSPDPELPPSNATPLTKVQLAGQELISKNKKRRRPKKKVKSVVDLESANAAESSDAQSSATPGPSSAIASFQSVTIEDDDEGGISTAHSTPPPVRRPIPATGGVITAKPARNRGKKNKSSSTQQSVQDNDVLPDQGERHYEDQPFLLCCKRIGISHPVNDRGHGHLLTLTRRIAGIFPDQLVIGPKAQYGVVWCDFNIVFGLAYHIKACGERGINFYGTDDWASGEITEILVQAPETVTSVEAPRVRIECLVRQRHSVDFVCPGHDAHTFTLFEVQWQAQGEAKSREVIRKICEDTGRDFAQTLRKYRIEKL